MNNDLLKEETLAQKFISKGFWLYLFTFLSLPLGYVIRVILSNDLSVSEVGIIYGMISLIGLLSALSGLGLNSGSLIYFLPKYIIEKKQDYTNTIYKIVRYTNITMTIIVSLGLYFFIQYFGNNYIEHNEAKNILYIFLGLFVFLNLANPLIGIFQTLQNVFITQLSSFISQAIISIGVISLFILGIGNILGYSLMFLVGNIIAYSTLYLTYKIKYSKKIESGKIIKDYSLFKKMIYFGINALIGLNAMMLIANMDMQMILAISGTVEAGYYTNYMSLIAITMFFLGPILGILFPIISEFHNKNNYEKLKLLINFLYKYLLIISISICVLLLVFGEVLAVILFGQDFLYSGTILTYLAIFGIFQLIYGINLPFISGIGKNYINRNILVGCLAFNILSNIIFVYFYGALGAGITTGITWFLIAVFSFYYVNKNIGINFDKIFLIKNIFIIAIIGIIYYNIIPNVFILENSFRYLNLLYLLIMGFGAYAIIFLANIGEVKNIFREIKNFKRS